MGVFNLMAVRELYVNNKLLILGAVLTLLLTACTVSLASDVTPPPTYQSPTPPPAQAVQSVAQPLLPPDPAQGAALYTDKCAPCHGTTGRGDGPQASKLGLPVPAIGTLEFSRTARPADWFSVVTNGRMDKGMPPFRSLTDRQRWDVVYYVYTLSTPQSALATGKSLYEQACVSCHGASGRGDGPAAASLGSKMPDWTNPGQLSQRSANDLFQVINTGVAPAMPAYASKFSDDERMALADYVRTFSFASNTSSPQQVAAATPAPPQTPVTGAETPTTSATTAQATQDANTTQAATPAGGTPSAGGTATIVPFQIAIAGKVTNSNGSALPAGLKVTLQGYDSSMSPYWSADADIQADGTYRFNNVDIQSGRTFLATVEYQNVPFQSTPLHSADLKPGQDASLPITITEVTTDASGLSAQRMHIFFDFTNPGSVQVAELFIINNPGDKAVVPPAAGKPVVSFVLPQGATDLSFQDGALGDGHYIQTDKGFGDATPVRAQDQLQVLFGYQMPYNGKLSVSIPLTLPVESSVVMVPSGGISVASNQLIAAGERNVNGANIQLFTANSLASGSTLDIALSGQPAAATTSGAPGALSSNNEMIIGIGVFGMALIVAGIWLYRQRRKNAVGDFVEETAGDEAPLEDKVDDTTESLLDAIVALDDLYQAGELPESAYQERRSNLKDRLKALKEAAGK
jgi:mono/diheme cytochrome c family protein